MIAMAHNWKRFVSFWAKLPRNAPLNTTLRGHSRRIFIADAPGLVPDHL
jgi:hypothetical protein